jgi:hypothetical protein
VELKVNLMLSDIDDTTAAFRAVNPAPAPAFEDTARSPQAVQTLERIMATRPGWTARHRWLRPAIVAAPLAGLAAAAAITLVLVAGGGGATTRISTAAYTLTKSPDGTVSVVFDPIRGFSDPRGLSRALASQGVPNRVLVSRPSCPPGSTNEGKSLPAARYVFSAGTGDSVVVHPNQMPPGSMVVVEIVYGPSGPYSIIGSLSDHPPTCITSISAR